MIWNTFLQALQGFGIDMCNCYHCIIIIILLDMSEQRESRERVMIPDLYGDGEHPFLNCGWTMSPEKRKEMEEMFPIPESQKEE